MISFTCARCGQKLQVPNELAGKSVRCSLCKHVMVIAQPAPLASTVALPQIVGPASSLARAGIDGGVTVGSQNSDSPPQASGHRSLHEILSHNGDGQRYQTAGEIARGGMGAVLRAVDCDIRREVAVKYLLDQADPGKKARFIEEAQITGQLEHPNIVPIHELGVDGKDRLFFAMKMVHGRSLQQVLKELRNAPKTGDRTYPLSRLLTIFVNICNALAYAHSRRVVHRDLKPANIMLGDFGEVYVMDWGLAKVLNRPETARSSGVVGQTPSFAWAEGNQSETSSATLQISGLNAADRTVDGTVMGTAVYMPPEQASGNIAAIDQRSDVYSLGAVLYEMLTLHPPIDPKGGLHAILERVRKGEIIPPRQRDAARTRGGKIPMELAAVVMKALAAKPQDRYQTVATLRGDVERFLEGRSVSVKDDTKREMLVKFVKRNKGFSLGAAAALLILFFSSIFLLQSWLETRRTYAAFVAEQEAKRAQARKSVPAFVEAARWAVQRRKFDDALAQVVVAVDYDPDHAGARLLKGQLLATRKQFAAARMELERYGKAHPKDTQAARLARLCAGNKPDDPAVIAELADILLRQDLPALAEGLLDTPGKLLEVYRRKIENAWPGLGKNLTMDADGKLSLNLSSQSHVLNFAPLQGMPLRMLIAQKLNIRDLTPLKGMPLSYLDVAGCSRIDDLKPLAGMPLTFLNVGSCPRVADLSPLAGMPLTFLVIDYCPHIKSLRPLRGMPLEELQMSSCIGIKDLSPLKELPLKKLNFGLCNQITDLNFLKGMALTNVSFGYSDRLADLTPLRDLPLKELYIASCPLEDLSPLKGMQLTSLRFNGCNNIADLSPLRGMPLTVLHIIDNHRISDLSPLEGMPLKELKLDGCKQISYLGPLKKIKLTALILSNCAKIADLTPLEGIRLSEFAFTPRTVQKGVDVLRRMKTLTSINGMAAAAFWQKYDAGAFRK